MLQHAQAAAPLLYDREHAQRPPAPPAAARGAHARDGARGLLAATKGQRRRLAQSPAVGGPPNAQAGRGFKRCAKNQVPRNLLARRMPAAAAEAAAAAGDVLRGGGGAWAAACFATCLHSARERWQGSAAAARSGSSGAVRAQLRDAAAARGQPFGPAPPAHLEGHVHERAAAAVEQQRRLHAAGAHGKRIDTIAAVDAARGAALGAQQRRLHPSHGPHAAWTTCCCLLPLSGLYRAPGLG